MSECQWCGVERDIPAAGPHVCSPERVYAAGLERAAQECDDVRGETFEAEAWGRILIRWEDGEWRHCCNDTGSAYWPTRNAALAEARRLANIK